MSSPTVIWMIILTGAVAVGIGFLVPVLFELRRSAKKLTSVLTIIERSLDPLLHDLNATVRKLDLVTADIGALTSDVRVFTGSARRVGRSVEELSGLVSTITFWPATRLGALRAGVGVGLNYLAKNLLRKGAPS
jgi:uncharacterized protein YoxC